MVKRLPDLPKDTGSKRMTIAFSILGMTMEYFRRSRNGIIFLHCSAFLAIKYPPCTQYNQKKIAKCL